MDYLRAKENIWKQSKNICKSLFTSVLLVWNCTCKLFFLLPFFPPEKSEDFSSLSRNIDVSYLNYTENWSNSWIDFFFLILLLLSFIYGNFQTQTKVDRLMWWSPHVSVMTHHPASIMNNLISSIFLSLLSFLITLKQIPVSYCFIHRIFICISSRCFFF